LHHFLLVDMVRARTCELTMRQSKKRNSTREAEINAQVGRIRLTECGLSRDKRQTEEKRGSVEVVVGARGKTMNLR
jgi:hypothetical protein